MSTQVTIELPDHIYRRVESIARQSQRDVNEVVADVVARSVRTFPVDSGREDMLREVAAFQAMHPTLWRDYPGQYVAVFQGRLVDHDQDAVTLLTRIRRDYPGQVVLRRKVEQTPEVILHFRSPRLSTRP